MGNHRNVTADKMPKQGRDLGKRCVVLFGYDTSRRFGGKIVRDDIEAPYRTIIQLDDGRYIMADECQYSPEG